MHSPIRKDVLFHYGMNVHYDPQLTIERGLLPLTVVDPERAYALADLFHRLDDQFATPVLGASEERHTGIYLTPIDFRTITGDERPALAWIGQFGRFHVPLSALESDQAVLTWEGPFPRTSLPLGPSALERAAEVWTATLVLEWFGRDRNRMFYHVPQVVTYQARVSVEEGQWEPPI